MMYERLQDWPETLPCGCCRGYFLCPEALRLWREYGRAYERRRMAKTEREKLAALADERYYRWQYDLHFTLDKSSPYDILNPGRQGDRTPNDQ